MDIFLAILLVVFCLIGVALVPLGMPGTFLICAAAFLYGLATGFAGITKTTVLLLLGAALLAEAVELLAGAAGARRYGSGNWAVAASVVGGIVGAVIGAPILFGIGSIPGALAGAFAAAVAVEFLGGKSSGDALKAGWGTFVGRLAGTIVKGAVAIAMTVICIQRLLS